MSEKWQILFVCNRSVVQGPMADCAGFDVKSEKLSSDWEKVSKVLEAHRLHYPLEKRIPITVEDFAKKKIIYCCDKATRRKISELKPRSSNCIIRLTGDKNPGGETDIPDPALYTDAKGYDKCFDLCKYTINYLLKDLETKQFGIGNLKFENPRIWIFPNLARLDDGGYEKQRVLKKQFSEEDIVKPDLYFRLGMKKRI